MKNKIVPNTVYGDIVLDPRITTRDGWVAKVKFICKRTNKRAHVLKEQWIIHIKQGGVLIAKSLEGFNRLFIELEHLF